jgi:predicted nuclease of restriction endonuclease-like (RecB) superfamily
MNNNEILDQDYSILITDLKKRVAESRYKATLSVNKEMVLLYHHIGQQILKSQKEKGWGSKVIEKLSKDLRSAFPEMKGFSPQNFKYMKKFAEIYTSEVIGQQAVDQLPWGHIIIIMYAAKSHQERSFYIQKTIKNGWSRNVLSMQIESNLYKRQGEGVNNFDKRLPNLQSDLAHNMTKDPYIFDFLSISDDAHEREIEKGLIVHMQKFLLELGEGFAFVGNQYHLEVGGQDFFIDMLFYNLKLRCYFVIELKNTAFKPEYSGKLNFYLSVIDDKLKHKDDNPSIGLILCRSKNKVVAEYSLRGMEKPIGLSEYKLPKKIADKLTAALPSIEELEKELSKDLKKTNEDKENE